MSVYLVEVIKASNCVSGCGCQGSCGRCSVAISSCLQRWLLRLPPAPKRQAGGAGRQDSPGDQPAILRRDRQVPATPIYTSN
jgi:hypothetical protein